MAIQNSKTGISKSQSIENLKVRLPEAFEKLQNEKKMFKKLTDDEKEFIKFALKQDYSATSIARCLKRSKDVVLKYIKKEL